MQNYLEKQVKENHQDIPFIKGDRYLERQSEELKDIRFLLKETNEYDAASNRILRTKIHALIQKDYKE